MKWNWGINTPSGKPEEWLLFLGIILIVGVLISIIIYKR
jgi:hypothetical protein